MKEIITLPSGKEIQLQELNTEQILQLLKLAKSVIRKLPTVLETLETAKLEYMEKETRGFVSKSHFESLSEEEQQALKDQLNAQFQTWGFFEDLSPEDQETLADLDITPETLKEEPIQFSFPAPDKVPASALAEVFPAIYDAVSEEIILGACLVMFPKGRLIKALKSNTLQEQLRDYRYELTSELDPEDFISLAAETSIFIIEELRGLSGPLGRTFKKLSEEANGLVGATPIASPSTSSESETSEKQETQERE